MSFVNKTINNESSKICLPKLMKNRQLVILEFKFCSGFFSKKKKSLLNAKYVFAVPFFFFFNLVLKKISYFFHWKKLFTPTFNPESHPKYCQKRCVLF